MTMVYFASDLHLGHRNICKYRTQFESSAHHDFLVTENILSKGGKRNHLYLLGDCFFTEESYADLVHFTEAYEKVHWILGNHCTDRRASSNNVVRAINEGLVDCVYGLIKYKEFWLSHAPIHPDELRGKINIHGHTHYNNIKDDRYYNVSLENIGYMPISLHDLRKNIEKERRWKA